jgi:hypothetical protein
MQKRSLLAVFTILVSASIFLVQGCTRTAKDELIGFWHEIPDTPSDWARTYAFFSDGSYQFNTNRMLCGRRLLSIKGAWTHKDGVLTLTHIQREHRVGGKLKPSAGSCADAKELIGAKTVIEEITPRKIETLGLKNIETDNRFKGTLSKMIHINGQPYWKFSDDPNYRGS